jgi:hypothetical protein
MAKVRNSILAASMERPIELVTQPGVCAYDGWINVSIGVWVGHATLPAVRRVLRMSSEQAQRYPQGRSSVIFVLDQVQAPTPEAQEELKKFYGNDGFACFAIVLEGTGFWASGIRGMAANAQRTASSGVVQRVSTTIDEVVGWLPAQHLARTGVTLPLDEFRRNLLTARESCARRARDGSQEA